MLGMASSVVMKVVGTTPASTQLTSKESGLPCTHHSNGHSPSSPIAPELTSPLPLEATPLPPSLPSPVSLTALENGLDLLKKEVEDNMFIKMLQQQVGIKNSIDAATEDTKETSKEKETEEFGDAQGKTQDLGLPILLDDLKDLGPPKAKKQKLTGDDAIQGAVSSSDVKVQDAPKASEKIKEQERPKLQDSVKPLPVQAIPLPISLGNGSLPLSSASGVNITAASRGSIPNIEALVSLLHRPDSNVKMVPAVKVLSVESGKEAVIPVQDKSTTSILASLQNIVQENASSASIASAALVTTHSNAASLPMPVTAVPLSSAAVFTGSAAPVVATVVPASISNIVPKSVPNSVAVSVPPVAVPNSVAVSVPPVAVPTTATTTITAATSVPSSLPAAPVAVVPPEPAKGPSVEKEVPLETGSKETSEGNPPSLHANEMLVDESEEEEDMDVRSALLALPAEGDTAVSQAPPIAVSQAPPIAPPSTRSDSASPYVDDDFAMFVAQEANEVLPVLDRGDSMSSSSPTPTPTPSANDLGPHDGEGVAKSHVHHFGVTASCPTIPLQLSEDAPTAPLDMTAHNFPKRSKYAHRAAMSAMHPYNRTRGGGAAVAKTLDLIKTVLQPSLNMEVKQLCDSYRNIFDMAASNISDNTGDTVPSSTLQMLIVKMLEEAKHGYAHGKWDFPTKKLPQNEKVTAAKGSPMSTKKQAKVEKEVRVSQSKRQKKGPSDRQNENRPIGWRWGMDKRRLDPLNWDPEKLNSETDFVLGVNVNKALGHAANRGKVYYLHPGLFKYACDGDDKTWLYENKHLPVHGGKAFLMIYSEVQALVKTEDCYKSNQDVFNGVSKLEQFSVPSFMIEKMKSFVRSVQIYFTQEANGTAASSSSAVSSSSVPASVSAPGTTSCATTVGAPAATSSAVISCAAAVSPPTPSSLSSVMLPATCPSMPIATPTTSATPTSSSAML